MTQPATEVMTLDLNAGGGGVELMNGGLPTPEQMGVVEGGVNADPAAVNAITAKAMAADAAPPEVKPAPSGAVTLLAGYVDSSGVRHTDVDVRELRGRDEETLAKAIATSDTGRVIDAIVRCGVTRIGEVEDAKELRTALDSLLIGDRDLLCMEIRRSAYGDTLELEVVCPNCSNDFLINYSFKDDVPLKQFEVDGFEDLSMREYSLTCPSGSNVVIRPMDGSAQKRVYTLDNVTKKTVEECNTLLLTDLISEIDGVPLRGNFAILDMRAKDRRFLLKWVQSVQPGPQYDKVTQECPECLTSFPLGGINLFQMFRGA